ncbi:DUF7521 family protein [Halovivax limisalsi]|uniref:DUF7521 family protein n=1 Tax=Halovivax limisalsi TaxID=1453760 RepID=UPI001FFCD1B9|nr:hypothetical protein [Halovivax limisalsi]
MLETVLVVVKIGLLVLGSAVSLLAYRAYRRTGIDGLQFFAVGLLIITLGTALVGVLHHAVGIGLTAGLLIESLFIGAGFVVISYALYWR